MYICSYRGVLMKIKKIETFTTQESTFFYSYIYIYIYIYTYIYNLIVGIIQNGQL